MRTDNAGSIRDRRFFLEWTTLLGIHKCLREYFCENLEFEIVGNMLKPSFVCVNICFMLCSIQRRGCSMVG